MEIIPIKNSTVNGQNAYNYGEWQGAIPCHWFSSKMILKPYERKNSFDKISKRKNVSFLKNSLEIVYRPILRRVKGPDSQDDLNAKPMEKKHIFPIFTQPKNYLKKNYSDIFKHDLREDEKIRATRQFIDIKYQKCPEYSVDEVMNNKKLIKSLDERRNFMPIIAPGDKLYRNVDYSPDFFKEGGLAVGSTISARYNKTVGKKANNFYDTLDLSIPTLDPKKLWRNKIYKEEQNFNKDYVSNLNSWEENCFGITKLSKEEKLKMKNTQTKNIKYNQTSSPKKELQKKR